jgi:GNAT superfamily N-acetyltransferase
MTDEVILRGLRIGDAGWLIEQHALLYARDEGFDGSFEALVAEILAAFLRDHDPATERGWIAEAGGRRLGSIFCVQSGEPGVAKLRLFLLLPEARGRGLGQRLLDECLGFAQAAGYRRLKLWTHESHRAACALYARNGFVRTASFPVHSFGRDLVEQSWEIGL